MLRSVFVIFLATLSSGISAEKQPTPGRECYRKCAPGASLVCYFHFEVHLYQTLSRACYNCPQNITDCGRPDCIPGDGVKRKLYVINRQMPGPAIQVCEGDQVIVDVKNSLPGEGVTIHWHGLLQEGRPSVNTSLARAGTPYMDGVPGVTQCPIHAGSTFRYSFFADNVGTHFYHAHSGFHRGDGVFGPFIVRRSPATEPNINTYDLDLPEHTIMVHDWLHLPTEDKYALDVHSGSGDFADNLLVNGLGPVQNDNASNTDPAIPYRKFKVIAGYRYRFRLINSAILNCPITFSIDQHMLTVIDSDGHPIVPVNASSLVIHSGERFDVVVNANCEGPGNLFWMSFMGSVDCADTQAHQFAFLEYQEQIPRKYFFRDLLLTLDDRSLPQTLPPKPAFTVEPPDGLQINTANRACYDDLICVADLRSPYSLPIDLKSPRAAYTFYLAFDMRLLSNPHYYSKLFYDIDQVGPEQEVPTPQINNLSYMPQSAPLLLNKDSINNRICNAETPLEGRNCEKDYCECLHMYEIPLGATVDLVFIDEGKNEDESHPIHLHGYSFWVIGQDRPNDVLGASITRKQVMEMDAKGKLMRNFDRPIRKDTVTVPDAGYTIVRFRADNPGFWLLHCHALLHSAAGMEMVLKVGNNNQIPKPPANFPNCGDFR